MFSIKCTIHTIMMHRSCTSKAVTVLAYIKCKYCILTLPTMTSYKILTQSLILHIPFTSASTSVCLFLKLVAATKLLSELKKPKLNLATNH